MSCQIHGSWQVEGLGYKDGVGYSEDIFCSIACVVGVKAGEVADDIHRGHAVCDGVAFHRCRFVVVRGAVVAAHQQLAHFTGFVELDSGIYARLKDTTESAVGENHGSQYDGHGLLWYGFL